MDKNVCRQNENRIREFAAAWALRDLERVMGFFAVDAVYRGSVGPEPGQTWIGKDAITAGVRQMFDFDDGSRVRQGRVMASGDLVFAEWVYDFSDAERPAEIGCDLFAIADGLIVLKDAYRKVEDPSSALIGSGGPTYRQRRFATRSAWRFGPTAVKVHLISAALDREPLANLQDVQLAAECRVEQLLSCMREQDDHFDVGYAIVHEGEEAHWLLFNWWIRGGICCSLVSRAAKEPASPFEPADRPYMACVWEGIAIEYERRAWVETALSTGADIGAYIDRRMPPGLY